MNSDFDILLPSSEIEIGARVRVIKDTDGHTVYRSLITGEYHSLAGMIGVVVQEYNKGDWQWGVDFSTFATGLNWDTFHRLNNLLPGGTGRWFAAKDLEIVSEF